jgi:hypothetical protein
MKSLLITLSIIVLFYSCDKVNYSHAIAIDGFEYNIGDTSIYVLYDSIIRIDTFSDTLICTVNAKQIISDTTYINLNIISKLNGFIDSFMIIQSKGYFLCKPRYLGNNYYGDMLLEFPIFFGYTKKINSFRGNVNIDKHYQEYNVQNNTYTQCLRVQRQFNWDWDELLEQTTIVNAKYDVISNFITYSDGSIQFHRKIELIQTNK